MDRWGCTKITAPGLFRVETALFTLKTLSRKLRDFRFGLLIMDSCYNYLKTASDIFAILRNQKKGICENGDPSKCLDPDRIVAVVGGDSSGATRQVHRLQTSGWVSVAPTVLSSSQHDKQLFYILCTQDWATFLCSMLPKPGYCMSKILITSIVSP